MSMKFNDSTKKLPIAQHLSDEQYKIFVETYAAHNRALWPENRDKYGIHNVTKVEAAEDGTIHVHYADGNWWHYTKSGEWY